mgnify:CR=1 FL=1
MELERLGRTDALVPKLGIGTYMMERDPESAVSAIRRAIELGMGLIDTAEIYGWGKVEEIVGRAVEPYDREEYFIVTKVWVTNLKRRDVLKSAAKSLKRLKTGYIDLYLIHWPTPSVKLAETLGAMEELVSEGLIRYIGVSNFDLSLLREAVLTLKSREIAANQVKYSLLDRWVEGGLLQYCQEEGITLMAYSPLEKGLLAARPPDQLKAVAARVGRTPAQVALNWLISKPRVIAIPKASRVEHVEENYGAVGWRLSEEDARLLDSLAPR